MWKVWGTGPACADCLTHCQSNRAAFSNQLAASLSSDQTVVAASPENSARTGEALQFAMSFFRSIWRGSSKHKKLYDEWALAGANDLEMQDQPEEVGFALKYIGSTLVESATSEAATADAVKAILNLSKAAGKKMSRVNLAVSTRGIKVTNLSTNELQLEVSIYRISYCSADAAHSQVFAFIATNPNETLECHAFLCPKRKVAQTVSLAVAHMFNTAFEVWQLSQDLADSQNRTFAKKTEMEEERLAPSENNGLLIDLDSTTSRKNTTWVNFDNDNVPNLFVDNMDNGNFFSKSFISMDQQRNLLCS